MKFKILTLLLIAFTFIQCKTEPKADNTQEAAPVVEVNATAFELPTTPKGVIHEFKALPYSYDALEPYIDAQTMEIHYSKHHVGYYKKFLAAIEGTGLGQKNMEAIFSNISDYSDAVRNTGGGYWNHQFFWSVMSPEGGELTGKLKEALDRDFGSLDNFKKEFAAAGAKRFGSGWAWLAVDKNGKLFVSSTANQNNPLMNTEEKQGTPLLTIDVWEHAYYLKYQNKRGDYLSNFWNVVNWKQVAENYETAME
jgi:Fe-Mn family superoxide dismutase